jgi:hypothetical protein
VPRGFAGGCPGGASDYVIYRATNIPDLIEEGRLALPDTIDGELTHPPANTGSLRVKEWDTFVFTSSGGGGLGDPLLRAPERVAEDVRAEYVTPEAARNLFGVVLDDQGDDCATNASAGRRPGKPPRSTVASPSPPASRSASRERAIGGPAAIAVRIWVPSRTTTAHALSSTSAMSPSCTRSTACRCVSDRRESHASSTGPTTARPAPTP